MKKLIIILMALCLGCATAGVKEFNESGREKVDYNHYLISNTEVYVFEYHHDKNYLVFVSDLGGIEVVELEDNEKEK